MTHSILLALTLLFFTTPALSWIISADFEKGNVGDVAELPTKDAFTRTADHSKVVSSPVLSGNRAGSVTATKGTTGFGKWGGAFYYPEVLKEGDQVWFRLNVYYPSGWDFSCGDCSQGMKFMRVHTASSSGSNEGYLDTLIKGSTTGGLITVGSEVLGAEFKANNKTSSSDARKNNGTPIIRDKWHTYEVHIKFSSNSGNGIHRVWQDGNLIFEDLKTATLRSSSSKADLIYLYTYWNNGAPRTQTSYVDDIIVTNEIPGRKDAAGNPYIGVGEYDYVHIADPKAASQLEAQ